jgi:hypothetical protein
MSNLLVRLLIGAFFNWFFVKEVRVGV